MSCVDVSLSPLSLSPLVSRIFPASFPNKQYQLLFTQGSGESKEGGTRPHHCVFFFFSASSLCIWNTRTESLNPSFWFLPADIVNYEFDSKNLVCLLISSVVGVWYLLKKVRTRSHIQPHWNCRIIRPITCLGSNDVTAFFFYFYSTG